MGRQIGISSIVSVLSYDPGSVIFREGDPAGPAFLVKSGTVALMKDGPFGHVAVAVLREGGVFGEVAGNANGARLVSASAVTAVEVEIVAADAVAAMLNVTNRRMLATGTDGAVARRRVGAGTPRTSASIVEHRAATRTTFAALRVLPDLARARDADAGARHPDHRAPFRVGRPAIDDEPPPPYHIHLSLDDERPFKLSRLHFLIDETPDGPVIVDCGSRLGTVVNGLFIHGSGGDAQAPLRVGSNIVVAGGRASEFRFKIVVLPNDR